MISRELVDALVERCRNERLVHAFVVAFHSVRSFTQIIHTCRLHSGQLSQMAFKTSQLAVIINCLLLHCYK